MAHLHGGYNLFLFSLVVSKKQESKVLNQSWDSSDILNPNNHARLKSLNAQKTSQNQHQKVSGTRIEFCYVQDRIWIVLRQQIYYDTSAFEFFSPASSFVAV